MKEDVAQYLMLSLYDINLTKFTVLEDVVSYKNTRYE